MEREIPVITVVSIMGTTEESAVDPLTEILASRDTFRNKVTIRSYFKQKLSRNSHPGQKGLGYSAKERGRTQNHNALILQLFCWTRRSACFTSPPDNASIFNKVLIR